MNGCRTLRSLFRKFSRNVLTLWYGPEDRRYPDTFEEEMEYQSLRILPVFSCFCLFVWIPYIFLDQRNFPDRPEMIYPRLGLSVIGMLGLVAYAFRPRIKYWGMASVTMIGMYLVMAATTLTLQSDANPAYIGGLILCVIIVSLLSPVPFMVTAGAGTICSIYFLVGLVLSDVRFTTNTQRYSASDLATAIVLAFAFSFILNRTRREAYTRARRISEQNQIIREKELEARRSSVAKSRFLATMSHELRTPLHGILGTAGLLRDSLRSEAETKSLRQIELAGEHLMTIINDVLDFSRLENNRLRMARENLDLAELLRTVYGWASGSAETKGLSISLDETLPGSLWVVGDAGRIRQIMLNLLSNAVKFTDRGTIDIRLERTQDRIAIEVRDTGQGIAPEDLEKIFTLFHQTDNTAARSHEGIGLGLTLSRELARNMKGDILCKRIPGEGSTFRFEFPFTPGSPVRGEKSSRPRLSGRVLLVDDNESVALLAARFLDTMGLECKWVDRGAAGVELFQRERFDLVLMDIQMPEMDGLTATRLIRDHERTQGLGPVPIVAVTADAFEEDRRKSKAAGMNEHLSKPFRKEQLWDMLARFLPPRV